MLVGLAACVANIGDDRECQFQGPPAVNEHCQSIEEQRQRLLPGYIKRGRRRDSALTDVFCATKIVALRLAQDFFRVACARGAWSPEQAGRVTSELIHAIDTDALWCSAMTHIKVAAIAMKTSAATGVDAFIACGGTVDMAAMRPWPVCPDWRQLETEWRLIFRYLAFCAVPAVDLKIVWDGALCAALIMWQEL